MLKLLDDCMGIELSDRDNWKAELFEIVNDLVAQIFVGTTNFSVITNY